MSDRQQQSCIDACICAARTCEHCEEVCLSMPNVGEMVACIRKTKDCAAICWLTAAFMSRRSSFDTEVCQLCAAICADCAAECAKHEEDHCRRCAEACLRCQTECQQLTIAV